MKKRWEVKKGMESKKNEKVGEDSSRIAFYHYVLVPLRLGMEP